MPDVMPSEDPNRKELVCLVRQTRNTCASTFLNIVRLDGPKREFFNLTDNTDMGTMEAMPRDRCESRFDWLLPATEPSSDLRAAARVYLELQGVDPKKLISNRINGEEGGSANWEKMFTRVRVNAARWAGAWPQNSPAWGG